MLIWLDSFQPATRRFLFLDRDGVINEDRSDYVKNWGEFRFYPDALEALRWLRDRGVNVILISNQSALHRGLTSHDDFWDLHRRMLGEIRNSGGDFLATFYCPHRPDESCSCRKPNPAMILAASRLFSIPLERTFMIGDRATDILAGVRAGCRGALLDRPAGDEPPSAISPDLALHGRYANLMEAVAALWEQGWLS